MIFVDLIAWFVFLFLGYYVLLQLYIINSSSKGRIIDIEKKNYIPKFQQNITVIIYSHNNASTVLDLIESLKKQNYDTNKYSINIILDNCEDNSAKLLEILGGTRLWRVNTDIKPIGKNKAVAWLLERIMSSENTNAFVFLSADCFVKPDFLSKINAAIYDNQVLTGEVLPSNICLNLITRLVCLGNKVKNRVTDHGRYYACLGNILENDVWAIRQDILEKVKFSNTDYGFEEYEYSIKLNKAKILVANSYQLFAYKQFVENLKSVAVDDYKKRYKRFITFKNNLLLLFSKESLKTKELLLSLIYPSSVVFIILNLV
ncbi:MAG: glycosyltransferase, partial [bacterium]